MQVFQPNLPEFADGEIFLQLPTAPAPLSAIRAQGTPEYLRYLRASELAALDPNGPISHALGMQARRKLLDLIDQQIPLKLHLDVDQQSVELHVFNLTPCRILPRQSVVPIRVCEDDEFCGFQRLPAFYKWRTFDQSISVLLDFICENAVWEGQISPAEFTSLHVSRLRPNLEILYGYVRAAGLLLSLLESGDIEFDPNPNSPSSARFVSVDREMRPELFDTLE